MVALPSDLPTPIQSDLITVLENLSTMEHGKLIRQVLETILRMMGREADRLDWKILNHALLDMEQGFQIFYPYRHIRKITIFGSARMGSDHPDYQLARNFAHRITDAGFMVMTGAGGGIMEAGNLGAGHDHSFGLNIQLPFEQGANPVMAGNAKLKAIRNDFCQCTSFSYVLLEDAPRQAADRRGAGLRRRPRRRDLLRLDGVDARRLARGLPQAAGARTAGRARACRSRDDAARGLGLRRTGSASSATAVQCEDPT
jgi:hypothetical protein